MEAIILLSPSTSSPVHPGERSLIDYLVADNSLVNPRCCSAHGLGSPSVPLEDTARGLLPPPAPPPQSLRRHFWHRPVDFLSEGLSDSHDSGCAWGLSARPLSFHISRMPPSARPLVGCREEEDPLLPAAAPCVQGAWPRGAVSGRTGVGWGVEKTQPWLPRESPRELAEKPHSKHVFSEECKPLESGSENQETSSECFHPSHCFLLNFIRADNLYIHLQGNVI